MAISYNGLWKQLIDHGMKKRRFVCQDWSQLQYNSKDDKLRVGETICFGKNLQRVGL